MNEANARYKTLCQHQDDVHAKPSTARLTDAAIQELVEFAPDVYAGIENADFQTKRRIIEMLRVRV